MSATRLAVFMSMLIGIGTWMTLSTEKAAAADEATLPPPRQVPALNAPDTHPNACVDCHIVYKGGGLDTRLSVLLSNWTAGTVEPGLLAKGQASAPAGVRLQGRHPKAGDATQDIPAACLDCHGAVSTKAPPFARLMHLIHLTGGAQSPYMTVFQGECTYCHKLDAQTGAWSVPSSAEPHAE